MRPKARISTRSGGGSQGWGARSGDGARRRPRKAADDDDGTLLARWCATDAGPEAPPSGRTPDTTTADTMLAEVIRDMRRFWGAKESPGRDGQTTSEGSESRRASRRIKS